MKLSHRLLVMSIVLTGVLLLLAQQSGFAQIRKDSHATAIHPLHVWGLGAARAVSYSPDALHILIGAAGNGYLINTKTYERERVLTGACAPITSAAFSVDGARVVMGGGAYDGGGFVTVWDTSTGAILKTLSGCEAGITSVAFSGDGACVLAGSHDNMARLWNLATGQIIQTYAGHTGRINAVAFSPDGSSVLTGSSDGAAKLWDAATGAEIRRLAGHAGAVYSAVFSPDGARILTGSHDKTAKLWDAATGTELQTLSGSAGEVACVAFHPNGEWVLTVSKNGSINLWRMAEGAIQRSFADFPATVAAFSPDGGSIIGGSSTATCIWDTATGEIRHTFPSCAGSQVAFGPGGNEVAFSSSGGVSIHDAATGILLRTISIHYGDDFPECLAVSPDGSRILIGTAGPAGQPGRVLLYDSSTGEMVRAFDGNSDGAGTVAFSPDGRRVLCGTYYRDNAARLWNADTGALLHEFADAGPYAAFSQDGTQIISGSYLVGDTVKVWNAETGELVRTIPGAQGPVAISPNGLTAVTGSLELDSTVNLWDLGTGELLQAYSGNEASLYSVTFSPDGGTILSAARGEDVYDARIVDLPTGVPLMTFPNAGGSAMFSPDGQKILTGAADGAARLWFADGSVPAGSMQVTIHPAEAATAGAMWSVDSGATWHSSESNVEGILPGTVWLTFRDVEGWIAPETQYPVITHDGAANVTGVYTEKGPEEGEGWLTCCGRFSRSERVIVSDCGLLLISVLVVLFGGKPNSMGH